ncbi:hypothetical protein B5S33_g1409 [[Candida] boidinii]|nr:hypothetical protein B5S33_g1409 [[Candida] boidinii]GMF51394.1 unnamed protein product [[Candida] boidinii]
MFSNIDIKVYKGNKVQGIYLDIMTEDVNFGMRHKSTIPQDYKFKDLYSLPKTKRTYGSQFNQMYNQRVKSLKSRVMKMAIFKWKNETINDAPVVYTNKILDVKDSTPCYIIGTVFMDMKYKPNILKEVSENMYAAPVIKDLSNLSKLDQIRTDSYSDPKTDQIMLEDESGRIVLDGELLDKIILATGAVVGLLGMEIESGVFTVVDIVYPEPSPQIPRLITNNKNKIAFISGINITPNDLELGKLEILKDYLLGELMTDPKSLALISSITRLVISGNSVRVNQNLIPNNSDSGNGSKNKHSMDKNKYRDLNKSNYNADAMRILDGFLYTLLSSMSITIMPGENDPSEIGLPQQEFHKSFFPQCKQYSSQSPQSSHFQLVTNPTWLEMDNVRMLGTSGENINDVFKYLIPNIESGEIEFEDSCCCKNEIIYQSRMKMYETSILWQNIVPTSPDTLWCYPFESEDPFTLTETPHVYFIGNQPSFETKMVELYNKNGDTIKTRIFSIPVFKETGEIVLLDTDTLDCSSIKICD